jgi:hypothetical protein
VVAGKNERVERKIRLKRFIFTDIRLVLLAAPMTPGPNAQFKENFNSYVSGVGPDSQTSGSVIA